MKEVKAIQTKSKRKSPARPVVIGQDSIVLEGQSVHFTLKRSFRAKMIWLKYNPDSGFEVTVPRLYDVKKLPDFLRQNAKWILRHRAKPALPPQAPEKSPELKDSVLFMGKPLSIQLQIGKPCNQVTCSGTELKVDLVTAAVNSAPLIIEWLQTQALSVIVSRVKFWGLHMKLAFNRICIRNQRTRWGSCSHLRNLNFNWRLIMVPMEIIDYVVIHELCHLVEMNHSRKFWEQVSKYAPQWRQQRQWLHHHHTELTSQIA